MWIRQVVARSFGPFKGEVLDLSPGFTVVVGANEAGKSSWHAATYAGLCGIRRGKGRRLKDDELFAARHEPWDGGPWEVATVLVLADGRTVELHHDLAGHLTSGARDLDLGRDITNEIIHDGAPDGSVWLGLDRRAFAAVACVRQAEILSVVDRSEAIQEHLQRAAATAGTDETAAAALVAIDQYRRDHVGLDRANSTKPLRVALERVYLARKRHEGALEGHADWLAREEDVARLEAAARGAAQQLAVAKASLARSAADQLNERAARLEALAQAHPQAPARLEDDDDLAAQVATAIHGWRQRPSIERLEGPDTEELRAKLASLPAMPSGDIDPHPSVVAARRVLAEAVTRADAHQRHAPDLIEMPDTGGADVDELEAFAQRLSVPVPEVDPALRAEVDQLSATAQERAATASLPPLLIAEAVVAVALGGAAGFMVQAGQVAGAAALGAVSLVLLVVALLGASRRRQRRANDDGGAALRVAEAKLAAAEEATAAGIRQRAEVVAELEGRGLRPDVSALRNLIRQVERARDGDDERRAWEVAQRHIDEQVTSATGLLMEAMVARRIIDSRSRPDATTLIAQVDQYEAACRDNRALADLARSRTNLETELRVREQAEQRAAAAAERLARIESALMAVGAQTRVLDSVAGPGTEADLDQLVERLGQWEQQRAGRRAEREQAVQGWQRLQAMLDGRSLDEWKAEARRTAEAADQLSRGLDPDHLRGTVNLGGRPEEVVRRLDEAAVGARLALAEARRELAVRAETLDPVAETAEELAAAEAELARLRRLEQTLVTTHQFMAAAQDRVHRDLAPVLAERVRHRLVTVTGGRYTDVAVDPQTLAVQVRDPQGRWRDAALLSQGTAEQVFLLLRVAMAEILTTDSCPLLLDDVTVQSDPVRTQAVLDVLKEVSADHQVVLFSQEDDVASWARANLGGRDRLVELEPIR